MILAAVLTFAATDAQADPKPPAVTVEIDNFSFQPKELVIAPGTEVTWVNHDIEPHTAVSAGDPKAFKSPALDTGDTFSFVFRDAGSYAYFCSIHPHMQATITVK